MISITPRAWRMMMLAARTKTLEVAGFAKARITDDGVIEVLDVIIPPQDVGSAHADIDVGQLDWLMSELLARGEAPKDWFLHWHSHVNMGTSPSSIDQNTLFELAKQSQAGFAVGLVVNIRGETNGRVAFKSPVLPGQLVEQTLNVEVQEEPNPELEELVGAMMEQVKEKKWQATTTKAPTKLKRGNPREQAPAPPEDQLFDDEFVTNAMDKFHGQGWQALTDDEVQAVMQGWADKHYDRADFSDEAVEEYLHF